MGWEKLSCRPTRQRLSMVVVTRHRRYRKPLTGPSGLLGVTPVLICSRGRWRKALGKKKKKRDEPWGTRRDGEGEEARTMAASTSADNLFGRSERSNFFPHVKNNTAERASCWNNGICSTPRAKAAGM